MAEQVPKLVPRPLSLTLRTVGRVAPGVRSVINQIEPYTAWWDEQNQAAVGGDGPLLVAIGDSTAIGIGATTPERSYVGLIRHRLETQDQHRWRVINLALSGARVADALDRQLPILETLAPTLVVCCVGTNDLVWGADVTGLRSGLRTLARTLPDVAVIGSLAGSSARAQLANRALRNATTERSLPLVDPWGEPGARPRERLASDRFHPNDLGYQLMAEPFCRQLGLSEAAEKTDGPGPGR